MPVNTPITPEQASSAVYVDFEGTEADPAQLLGVLTPDGEFTQFVLNSRLGSAALARSRASGTGHCVIATIDEAVEHIARYLDAGTVVAAWSRHEYDVIMDAASPSPSKTAVLSALRDAKATAKRWKRREHPDVQWTRIRYRGINTLDRFMNLVGYDVPSAFGPGLTGKRLRRVHQQLEAKHSYDRITPTTKAQWTKLLEHNRHDCVGMRAVVLTAA
jgi:hypothetical protein